MAKLGSTVEVPLSHGTKCPVCDKLLDIIVMVEIPDGSVRVSGRNGLTNTLSVHLGNEPKNVRINQHECTIADEKKH